MRNPGRIFFPLFFLLAVFFAACGTSSKTTDAETTIPTKKFKPEDYINNRIHYHSFHGKASLSIRTKADNQTVGATIKLKKDQFIWSSVNALGGLIEVARANITPDSLKAIVRIGKKYYKLTYEQGQELIKAQVEFPQLQDLIVGNPLFPDGKISSAEEKNDQMRITIRKDEWTQVLVYDAQTHLLKQLKLSSSKRPFTCLIDYDAYRPLSLKEPFAFSRKMRIDDGKEQISIEMNFDRAEVNVPVETSFSIPSSYSEGKL